MVTQVVCLINAEEVARSIKEHLAREVAVALVGGVLKGVPDAGSQSFRAVRAHSEVESDGIGGLKPDAADVASEGVGVVGDCVNRFVLVSLVDLRG